MEIMVEHLEPVFACWDRAFPKTSQIHFWEIFRKDLGHFWENHSC